MIIEKEKTIGQIVADDYRTAAIFKSFGIDFCCKGNRTISEVCNQKIFLRKHSGRHLKKP